MYVSYNNLLFTLPVSPPTMTSWTLSDTLTLVLDTSSQEQVSTVPLRAVALPVNTVDNTRCGKALEEKFKVDKLNSNG